MKDFMDQNFLLRSPVAQSLYHDFAAKAPILDYHCHIDPKEIAQNRRFENIAQVWLGGDHYKWRQMRSNGVEECYITGDAPDREKFQKWAETLDKAVGNPLFHWSHLELRRYFGYTEILSAGTAQEVWELCNAKLQEPDMSVRSLICRSRVKLLCTTDDPADDLCWHKEIAADPGFDVQVLPAWRPDRALNIERPDYADYIGRLGESAGLNITTFHSLKEALEKRMAFFELMGCRASDHGLAFVMYAPAGDRELDAIFQKRLSGGEITRGEELKFKTGLMMFLAKEYVRLGWVMQLHFGCMRDNNRLEFARLGPDTGFDAISSDTPSDQLYAFLSALYEKQALPKTILYSLNPNDDGILGSLIGCFQGTGAAGKIQQGSAWWFNDHKAGMEKQLTSLANLGLLGNFVGMLTDSRSFLSYPRHEYFRRILCNLLGGWVEEGEYPWDREKLGEIVKDISYNNAVRYFGFDLETV